MKHTHILMSGVLSLGVLLAQLPAVALAQVGVVVERVNFSGLAIGAEEARVSALKEILRTVPTSLSEGCANLNTANMKYGPTTEACVKAFQKMQGLPETGSVDEVTNRALNMALEKGISSMPTAQRMAILPRATQGSFASAQNTVTLQSLQALLVKLQDELRNLTQ